MSALRVIVFDIQHGFCAFVKSPNGYTLLIDLGKGDSFSPVEYILGNELNGVALFNDKRLTKLIISHPHDDHIEDIENLARKLPPAILQRRAYDWTDLKAPGAEGEYQNLDRYAAWQAEYCDPVTSSPNWGIDIKTFGLSIDHAKRIDEDKYVNNSSIVLLVTYHGTIHNEKFLFGGDIEQAGWTELLRQESFRNAIKDVDFYVASHHGHASGFSAELFEAFGHPPIANLVSAHRRDESVDSRYSSNDFATGVTIGGVKRRMLSTRHDGSVCIQVNSGGKFLLETAKLEANIRANRF